ncbi:MAG: flippase-like domain-containing protein [Candidatus Solibacter usitatus]|nr:flippase-like domain-containing protein [Candidatus Solibacter usitatus]
MAENNAGETKRGMPDWAGPALAYGISLGCLIWVYRDFDWQAELPRLKHIHWAWIILAVVSDVLVYVCQAWRWNLLLTPIANVPLGRSVQAVYIGLFANELLPLRSGEAIRCYLQSLWSKISFPVVISSALLERFFDGLWLIAGFACTTLLFDVNRRLKYGAGVLALLVGVLAMLLIFAVHRKEEAHDALSKHRWLSVFRHLVEGIHAMGRSRSFLHAGLASLLYLILQVVPIYAMMRGYGLEHLSFAHAGVVLVILRLGTVVPGPPGNIGVFNFFAMTALRLLGVDRQVAKGLSGVMFFVITVPLLIGGCIAVALGGLKIHELRHKAHSHMRSGKE